MNVKLEYHGPVGVVDALEKAIEICRVMKPSNGHVIVDIDVEDK